MIFCVPAAAQDSIVLRPGEPLARELAPGASHTYRVELATDGQWHVGVGQRDVDVVVTVSGPGGESLVAVDSPFDRQGREAALFEAGTTTTSSTLRHHGRRRRCSSST